jgi:hypothetical protein
MRPKDIRYRMILIECISALIERSHDRNPVSLKNHLSGVQTHHPSRHPAVEMQCILTTVDLAKDCDVLRRRGQPRTAR